MPQRTAELEAELESSLNTYLDLCRLATIIGSDRNAGIANDLRLDTLIAVGRAERLFVARLLADYLTRTPSSTATTVDIRLALHCTETIEDPTPAIQRVNLLAEELNKVLPPCDCPKCVESRIESRSAPQKEPLQ